MQTLTERIDEAIRRISEGSGLMRIPVDQTDPDMVLGDCKARIADLENKCAAQRDWIDQSVAKCAARGCVVRDSKIVDLERENSFLRARAGNDEKACVYCGLGADEQGQCASGFPGCARADDQTLCREAGVAMERDALKRQNEALRKGHERYETVRRMTPGQFEAVYRQNLDRGTPFDALVDDIQERGR